MKLNSFSPQRASSISLFIISTTIFETSFPTLALGQVDPISSAASAAAQAAAQAAQAAAQMMGQGLSNTSMGQSNMSQGQANQNQAQAQQGMMQMLQGAMQIASAILGALASQAAGGQSGKGNQNASNLGDMGASPYQSSVTPSGTSPTPSNVNSSNSGTTETSNLGDPTASKLDISPPGLHAGQVGAALDTIEKNFGINRDDFVKALANGTDPKDIFANAPKNAGSPALLSRIADSIAPGGSATALASGSAASAPQVAAAPAPVATGAAEQAGGAKAFPNISPEGEGDGLNTNVSPEVRAALAARLAQQRQESELRASSGWSIFELVHSRYRKIEPMLYGRVENTNPNPVPEPMRPVSANY